MPNAIGIIFANSVSDNLQGLALNRPIAAIPFAGRYRILDFAFSSMVNSGISTIGLVTPHQYRPHLDHLGSAKDWLLERKHGGMFILPGVMHGLEGDNHTFCIKDLKYNSEYLKKNSSENVVISSGNQIFNMNFMEPLKFHKEKQADVTLIYKECNDLGDPIHERLIEMNDGQKVSNIVERKVFDDRIATQPHFANMLIIRRGVLLDIIEKHSSLGCLDLMEILTTNLATLNVYGSPTGSLIGTIRTVNDYFKRSMELLGSEVRSKLCLGEDHIHTRIVNNAPTQYSLQAKISNSLIASGCSISGEVVNSIIFHGVIVEQGCKIHNSIILPKCHIHQYAKTDYAILAKSVKVHEGNVLKGSINNPLVVLNTAVKGGKVLH